MRLIAFICVLALTACGEVPIKDGSLAPSEGSFRANIVAQQVLNMEARGETVRMDQGHHWSANTLFLRVAECVGPKAQFGFHGAWGGNPAQNRASTRYFATFYNDSLRHWFFTSGASRPNALTMNAILSGQELHDKHGYPLCTLDTNLSINENA